MDFSVNALTKMEKELTVKLNQVLKASKVLSTDELTHHGLMKMNKDTLANFVEDLAKLMNGNIDLCKSAAGKIDELKSSEIEKQREMAEIQEKQLDSVQKTVMTEMQSWNDTFSKNCVNSAPSVKIVQKAVKTVVEEDIRSKNLIIYGAYDWVTEDLCPVVDGVFDKIGLWPPPEILAASRIGVYKDDAAVPRPIKVTLASSKAVKMPSVRQEN